MLFADVINIFWAGVLSLIAAILPSSSGLPSSISNAIESMLGYLYAFSYIFPVNTLLTAIIIVGTFQAGIFVFKFFRYVFNLLRGSGA